MNFKTISTSRAAFSLALSTFFLTLLENSRCIPTYYGKCARLNKFIDCFEPAKITSYKTVGSTVTIIIKVRVGIFAVVLFPESFSKGFSVLLPNSTFSVHDKNGITTKRVFNDAFTGHVSSFSGKSDARGHLSQNHTVFEGHLILAGNRINFEAASKYFNKSQREALNCTMIAFGDPALNFSLTRFDAKVPDIISRHRTRFNSSRLLKKRALPPDDRRTCVMKIYVDHTYYSSIRNYQDYSNDDIIERHILRSISSYVTTATDTFWSTKFFGGETSGYARFVVGDIVLFKEAGAVGYSSQLSDESNDVSTLLDVFASYDHSQYCLGGLLVHRDFAEGVIGLAYVGTADGALGGICDPRTLDKSLNAWLVTSVNFGDQLSERLISLTVVHEIGHSFGAMHDPDPVHARCAPQDSAGGLFVMTTVTPHTVHSNMAKFSPCSIDTMAPVIELKADLCFGLNFQSICGNQILEEGEQCDCGYAFNCVDKCCMPGCELSSGSLCSPQSTFCCTEDCNVAPAIQPCRAETECALLTHCDGQSEKCPPAQQKEDYSPCFFDQRVCLNGTCDLSACEYNDLSDCSCEDEDACVYCCTNAGQEACRPSKEYGITTANNEVIKLKPGQRCGMQSACNENLKCIKVGTDAVLKTLREGLDKTPFQRFQDFMSNYWFHLLIALLLLLMLIFAIVALVHRWKIQNSYGRYSAEEAEILVKDGEKQATRMKHRGPALSNSFEKKRKRLLKVQQVRSDVAVTRLASLFPQASMNDIVKAMMITKSERKSVKKLLKDGHVMRKLPT